MWGWGNTSNRVNSGWAPNTRSSYTSFSNNTTKYIRNSRSIKKLTEVEGLISKECLDTIKIVDSIFDIKKETLMSVFKNIQNSKQGFAYFTRCILYAIDIYPQKQSILAKLLSIIVINSKTQNVIPTKDCLTINQKRVLYKFGLIQTKVEDINLTEIEQVIMEDNQERFMQITNAPGFDKNGLFECSINYSSLMYPQLDKENVWVSNSASKRTLIQLIAFFGAIKCFNYAVMDGTFNLENAARYAVAGGNTEIISKLKQKSVSFDECFSIAVIFNRNEICDWLLENYKCEEVSLSKTQYCFNDRAFFFMQKNNIVNDQIHAFFYAVEKCNLNVIKYMNKDMMQSVNYTFTKNDNKGNTVSKINAMSIACKEGLLDAVKLLAKECQADTEISSQTNVWGTEITQYPIHIAAQNGKIELVKYLVEECHCNCNKKTIEKNSKGSIINQRTALDYAAKGNSVDVMKYLTEECNMCNEIERKSLLATNSVIHAACMEGSYDVVNYLINRHNCDFTDNDINSAIGNKTKALLKEKRLLHDLTEVGNMEMLKIAMEKLNCNINQKYEGKTVLHLACKLGNLEMVKYFIEELHGDPEVKDIVNQTPLLYACNSCNIEIVKYLYSNYHVNVEAESLQSHVKINSTKRAIHIACEKGNLELVKYLTKVCHAEVNVMSCSKGWGNDSIKKTPLHIAAQLNLLDIVKYLVEECNANTTIKTVELKDGVLCEGKTPLEVASRNVKEYLMGK